MSPQNHNKEKDANNEAEHEEPRVKDDQVVKYLIYFNIFECGKNLLNKLDASCERSMHGNPKR